MNTKTQPDDELPAEIEFPPGTRRKFYRPGATLSLPVYLETRAAEPTQAAGQCQGNRLENLTATASRTAVT